MKKLIGQKMTEAGYSVQVITLSVDNNESAMKERQKGKI